jgi:hypothetical protein
MRAKQDCFFWALPTKSLMVMGEKCMVIKCPKKDLQCYCVGIWWEKRKSISNWKSSKSKMFQEPELIISSDLEKQ